jgi:hypothetical protein
MLQHFRQKEQAFFHRHPSWPTNATPERKQKMKKWRLFLQPSARRLTAESTQSATILLDIETSPTRARRLSLYVVVQTMTGLLYSGSGYRALSFPLPPRLKKKRPPCRYLWQSYRTKQETVEIQHTGNIHMSKRELIDRICEINKTAKAEFLATFSEEELQNYLEHLRDLDLEELTVCA